MQPQKELAVNVRSAVFAPAPAPVATKLSFRISFHNPEVDAPPQAEGVRSQADLLTISFNQTRKIPAEVEEYINNNLGTFELAETPDSPLKTLSFELKINDIDSEKILRTFDDFFSKRLAEAYLDVHFEKSGTLEEMLADLKAYSQVPILLQILERGNLSAKLNHHVPLVEGLVQYLKSQSQLELAQFVRGAEVIASFHGDVTLASYKGSLVQDFKSLGLDQRDLMKEFFLAFENPLVKYIFENGQDGTLTIKGRILNIMNYEVHFECKGASEFLYKIRTMH